MSVVAPTLYASGRGVKVEAVLKDDETLTSFLLKDVPLTQSVVNQLVSAQIRPEQVSPAHTQTHTHLCTPSVLLHCSFFPPVCLWGSRPASEGHCLQHEPAGAIPRLLQPSRTLRCSKRHVHLNPAATADHRRQVLRQC